MNVAVVGLGKIGLPLAVQIAGGGADVVGLDVPSEVVTSVSRGTPPFPNEPELEERLRRVLADGRFRATTDAADAVPGADVVILVVPLVVDEQRRPDFRIMDAATETVGRLLTPGALVSYETTLPVGATRHRFTPRLAQLSGLTVGVDLFVCHSPERVSSGSVFRDLARYPKLVGGVDDTSEQRAIAFYDSVLGFDDRPDLARPNGVWPVGGAEAAELAKLAETTYRDINIAYANELACAAEGLGVDVFSIIEACNSQPYSHIHRPGISVGGHCIPVYPHLLMESVPGLRLPAVARDVNDGMPAHAVDVIDKSLGGLHGRRVAVLGLAFRGGVKEAAFSGTHALIDACRARGATAPVHDVVFDASEIARLGYEPYVLGTPCDAVVLHTDHPSYAHLSEQDVPGAKVVYDGRGILDASRFDGVRVVTIGRPMPA